MTTLLIDGSNIAAAHFTTNSAVDTNGVPCGAIKGVLTSTAYICSLIKPSKIILFFDGKDGSLQRRAFHKEYKNGRRPMTYAGSRYVFGSVEKMEQNKQWQHETLKQLLDLLPINVITTNGFEADDGIAYLVKHKEYFELGDVVIASSDKDFIQLISEKVKIYSPTLKVLLDADAVCAKHGVRPEHWAFYRAISGDPSDNIKPVGGVGPVKFAQIFSEIKHELSPEDLTEKFSEHKSYAKIFASKGLIEENYKLVDLKNPMMSMSAKDGLEKAVKSFEPKFKKFEFLRKLVNLGIIINFNSFDVFLRLI